MLQGIMCDCYFKWMLDSFVFPVVAPVDVELYTVAASESYRGHILCIFPGNFWCYSNLE